MFKGNLFRLSLHSSIFSFYILSFTILSLLLLAMFNLIYQQSASEPLFWSSLQQYILSVILENCRCPLSVWLLLYYQQRDTTVSYMKKMICHKSHLPSLVALFCLYSTVDIQFTFWHSFFFLLRFRAVCFVAQLNGTYHCRRYDSPGPGIQLALTRR